MFHVKHGDSFLSKNRVSRETLNAIFVGRREKENFLSEILEEVLTVL